MQIAVEIDDDLAKRLQEFRKIFDAVMDEEYSFDDYISLVLNIGLEKMLRDSIPEGQEWNTIEYMFRNNPDMISETISGIWKNIRAQEKEEMNEIEHKIRKNVERYIR